MAVILQTSDKLDSSLVKFQTARVTWYRPTSLDQMLDLMQQHPDARLIVGGTKIGETNKIVFLF